MSAAAGWTKLALAEEITRLNGGDPADPRKALNIKRWVASTSWEALAERFQSELAGWLAPSCEFKEQFQYPPGTKFLPVYLRECGQSPVDTRS